MRESGLVSSRPHLKNGDNANTFLVRLSGRIKCGHVCAPHTAQCLRKRHWSFVTFIIVSHLGGDGIWMHSWTLLEQNGLKLFFFMNRYAIIIIHKFIHVNMSSVHIYVSSVFFFPFVAQVLQTHISALPHS